MTDMDKVAQVLPLSPLQEGILFHTISAPNSGVFVTQIAIELTGSIDPAQLQMAWEKVVQHHAALRTGFLWDGLDEPVQVVFNDVKLNWQLIDPSEDFSQWLAQDRARDFDLAQVPLMRLVLMPMPDGWRLVWTFHHILMDGWSAHLVLRDVLRIIAGKTPKTSISYDTFLDTIQTDDSLSFWKDKLRNRDAVTIISDPLVKSVQNHRHLKFGLTTAETDALDRLGRSNRVTLNTLVLGAWARCIASVADDPAPLFGTTVTTRPETISGIEDAVGLYINTLPLTVSVDERPVSDWLRALQDEQQICRNHALVGLADIQRTSAVPQGVPLFQSIVVMENHGGGSENLQDALAGTGISVQITDFVDQSNAPLALLAIPGQRLEFELVYDANRYGGGFAQAMLDGLKNVLAAFVADDQSPISQIALAPPTTATAETESDLATLLPKRIASHSSNKIALVSGNGSLTYKDLHAKSLALSGALIAAGATPNEAIGLYSRRGEDFVIGMLAILNAGGTFVPLDPDYPDTYNLAAAKNVGLKLVLTAPDLETKAQGFAPKVLTSDVEAAPQTVSAKAEDPAYILHTSGSQGLPKGVVVSHENIAYSTAMRRNVYDKMPKRFLLLSPVAFDSAMVGLFWTLAEGGTLVLPAPGEEKDIAALEDYIHRESITHLLCIPSLWQMILEFANPDQFSTLQTVIVAGEPCLAELTQKHQSKLPGTQLFNEYGPTEASVWCLAANVGGLSDPVPIGNPIPHTAAYLMDRWGNPMPQQLPGELWISGPGVAQGYLNLPEETNARFGDDPFHVGRRLYKTGDVACRQADGSYVFLGRLDAQIKINGHRIEPAEIAARLNEHPNVRTTEVLLVDPQDPAVLAAKLGGLPKDQAETLLRELNN